MSRYRDPQLQVGENYSCTYSNYYLNKKQSYRVILVDKVDMEASSNGTKTINHREGTMSEQHIGLATSQHPIHWLIIWPVCFVQLVVLAGDRSRFWTVCAVLHRLSIDC